MRKSKLLITGIPGTGKTTVGNYLAHKRGFCHIDIEILQNKGIVLNSYEDIERRLDKEQDHTVLTWGFMPKTPEIEIIQKCKANGFKLIWFDGNRGAALREFMRRGNIPCAAFDQQICRIDSTGIINRIQPIVFNTFDQGGNFKNLPSIADELEKIGSGTPGMD